MADPGSLSAAQHLNELARAFSVQVDRDWNAARPRWEAALATGVATPFQHVEVVDAWYLTMTLGQSVEPLIVTVHDAASRSHVMSLALIRTRTGPFRTIAFADLDLVDYNAPILGPGAPRSASEAAVLWRALRSTLPPADLLDLRKMPKEIGGIANPMAQLGTVECALNGNIVHTGDDWNAYHFSLKRTDRKELERSWRVFTRHPDAAFRVITDPAERQRVLAEIERQQPLRMQATGKSYQLGAPEKAAFYHRLIEGPAAANSIVMTALTAGDEVVAALVGLKDANDYIMIRISHQGGDWANASPGKLIIARSMQWLHEQGQRRFDFSVGNYDYKRRFNVEPWPLVDLVKPLSWRGLPATALSHAKVRLRHHAAAQQTVRRLLRRGA